MKLFLGMDVSKGYADFLLLNEQHQKLEDIFQLDDNQQGHDLLKEQMKRWVKLYKPSIIYSGVESTGGFETNWYHTLLQCRKILPLQTIRLNPRGVKHSSKAELKRNVTDALSAQYIAEYLIRYHSTLRFNELANQDRDGYSALYNHIELLKKQQTQRINQFRQLIYNVFPEILMYCRNQSPHWVLYLLHKYPSADLVGKATVAKLSKIKYISQSKAEIIIKKARQSVVNDTHAGHEFLVAQSAEAIIKLDQEIEKYKKHLIKNCNNSSVTLLESISGVGTYTAIALLQEIGDINRFENTDQLAAYAGIHPVLKESGDKKYSFRMSKHGRAAIRALLYMPAMAAIRVDEHIKSIYHRHRAKGKTHKAAIGVVMHKLLRIVFGVLKNKTSYNKEIDKANAAKTQEANTKEKIEKAEIENKRRLQPLSKKAPISNIQYKKRKAYLEPQSAKTETYEVIPNTPV